MKMTNPDTPGTPETPAPPRRRLQRLPPVTSGSDTMPCLRFEDEDPEDIADHCRAVIDKFAPQCKYDHFMARLSAGNTIRLTRFTAYEQILVATKMDDQAPLLDTQYSGLDTMTRAALAYRDQEFLKTLRFLRDTESTYLRRAFLINRELRRAPGK